MAANGTFGALKVNVTSLPDGGDAGDLRQTPVLSSAGYFLSRLNVKTHVRGGEGLAVAPLHALAERVDSVFGSLNLWPVARNGVYVPSIGLGISSGS